jgi:predicted O-methyltransferase YrrM
MNCEEFKKAFEERFPPHILHAPTYELWDPIISRKLDPCFDIEGMLSLKKQQLLNLAFRHLDEGEAYFEVGTYRGKSLVSAMMENPPHPVFACDNFSQFEDNTYELLHANLARYGFADRVTFYNCEFLEAYTPTRLPLPIGFYFYDGAHDFDSQYEAIKRIEPFLADEALVLVDDWRLAEDSDSYAKEGTLRAAGESSAKWDLLYELPARFNGDRAMWWNGVGVLSFRRAS